MPKETGSNLDLADTRAERLDPDGLENLNPSRLERHQNNLAFSK